jgi:hypothetical protein
LRKKEKVRNRNLKLRLLKRKNDYNQEKFVAVYTAAQAVLKIKFLQLDNGKF